MYDEMSEPSLGMNDNKDDDEDVVEFSHTGIPKPKRAGGKRSSLELLLAMPRLRRRKPEPSVQIAGNISSWQKLCQIRGLVKWYRRPNA